MTPLSSIKRGRVSRPHFILIYGVDGVGKTTFGAETPNPVFLGPESGYGNLSVARFPEPRHFQDVLAAIQDLINGKHDFQTLAVDSLDWIEPLVHEYVCRQNNWKTIEDAGYGKGYVAANVAWTEMIGLLKRLRERMNVIVIAHATIKPFTDPEQNAAYDRYQLKLAGSGAKTDASAIWRETVDTVLFANFEVRTELRKGDRKAKAYGQGVRVIYTERRPAFDAKNRFSLPFELALSWDSYAAACIASVPASNPVADAAKIAEITKGQQDLALAWLIDRGQLTEGQVFADLSEKYRQRILGNPEGFLAAIQPAPSPEPATATPALAEV